MNITIYSTPVELEFPILVLGLPTISYIWVFKLLNTFKIQAFTGHHMSYLAHILKIKNRFRQAKLLEYYFM